MKQGSISPSSSNWKSRRHSLRPHVSVIAPITKNNLKTSFDNHVAQPLSTLSLTSPPFYFSRLFPALSFLLFGLKNLASACDVDARLLPPVGSIEDFPGAFRLLRRHVAVREHVRKALVLALKDHNINSNSNSNKRIATLTPRPLIIPMSVSVLE